MALVSGALLMATVAGWYTFRTPGFSLDVHADRNVLLVTIDTLRADALGAYGGGAATPNLDRLAAGGARFTFAHAHAVVTLPSHVSILGGRYPYEHGIRDNAGYRVSADERTIAVRLKPLGFATGAFIGAGPLDQRYGLARGFDLYDDRVGEMGSSVDFILPERRADQVVAPALEWIGRQTGRWLAWVHLFDPHAAYKAPPEWQARYPSDAYLGEVAWTDHALGPLFEVLGRQTRPTLVIVTSDHGESLGEHGELTHSLFAYEATLRVPLIVAEVMPASTAARRGVVIDTPVRHVDVLPTILEAVDAPLDDRLSGTSLRDLVGSGSGPERPMYFEAMTSAITRGWAPLRGVLVGREKYIDLPIPELYDLSDDPKELRNLVASRTARAEVLRNTLRTFDVAPPGRPRAETSAVRERLRALGYVGGVAPARDQYTEADDPKRLVELEQLLHRGTEAYQAGRYQDAVALYRQVIDRRADMDIAYLSTAFVYWRAGQPGPAIAALEEALARGSTQLEVRTKLAQYLAEVGRPDRAIALLAGLTVDDPDALNALGIAYAGAGRTKDAMHAFEAALAIDPTNGLALENIGTLHLQARDLPRAEASLRRALEIDPTLPGAHTSLGVVFAQTGRGDEAIESWKRAVAIDPTEFDALYNLTVALVGAGRLEEARPFGERYIATAPPALFGPDIARIRRLLDGGRL